MLFRRERKALSVATGGKVEANQVEAMAANARASGGAGKRHDFSGKLA